MRIIANDTNGYAATYEVISFEYESNEKSVYCLLTSNAYVKIAQVTEEQCKKYALQLFSTGFLNLLIEPAVINSDHRNVYVHID